MTEPQLIAALQQREEDAFQLLVERYKDQLYNTILGFLQNSADAEDVLQDVFIKVYESIQGFKAQSSIGTWMYRIAVTQSLDFLRKKKRKKRTATILSWFGQEEKQHFETTDFIHPGVLAENKEKAAHLFRAMEALPENQKTAFILQKVEGLSQQEIATIMQIKEGAVESLLSRAKQNLRRSLQQYFIS